MPYRPCDYWLLSDATGFKIRRSQSVKQYDGLVVERGYEDEKHPLEHRIQPRPDRPPRIVRPEPEDVFITDEITADDL